MVIISLLLTLLIACSTTKETVKLVYIYPTIIKPTVDDIPVFPDKNTITVEEYPDYVLYPQEELTSLGLYILALQEAAESLKLKLQYYIDNTDWNKNESE